MLTTNGVAISSLQNKIYFLIVHVHYLMSEWMREALLAEKARYLPVHVCNCNYTLFSLGTNGNKVSSGAKNFIVRDTCR